MLLGIRRILLTALFACALTSAFPVTAGAALPAPCFDVFDQVGCLTVTVPLDRSGSIPGDTRLQVIRIPAAEGPRLGTLFLVAGGPGQTSQVMLDFMISLFNGANRYDLVAIDQRGTGLSEPLNCTEIERAPELDGANPKSDKPITQCANKLGAARATYNTAEAIADLDAVRAELGVDKVSIFGVSYGTKVALAYAQQYPNRTKSLIIDSVLPVNEPGAFDLTSIDAMRKALAEICEGSRCKGILRSPVGDVAKFATQLANEPLEGVRIVNDEPERVTMTQSDLFELMFAADFNLFIYEQIPSAVRAALLGDTDPIFRLLEISGSTGEGDAADSRKWRRNSKKPKKRESEVSGFSNTLNVTTSCEDLTPPWPRGAPLGSRQPAIDAAAAAIPDSAFLPFNRTTIKNDSLATICRGWPESAAAPALPAGPLPDVPVLALNGSLDVRTPVAWAKSAIAGNPSAQLVTIPHTGHSTIGTDISGCALSLAKRFLIFGATDGKCKRQPKRVPVAPVAATSLNGVKPLAGSCRGRALRSRSRCLRAKKAVTAGYLAFHDALDQYVIGGMGAGPGLRGGTWEIDIDFEEEFTMELPLLIRMSGLQHVPGTAVSGRVTIAKYPKIDGTFTVEDFDGRSYRVDISGVAGYDLRDDRIVLSSFGRKASVTLRRRPSARISAKSTAAKLRTRSAFRSHVVGHPLLNALR
ncbi:MAG TPA: alpha/beta hydrolase [Solirubrobacterales bacterium]|nr:alpha/beta hydrolase [Solirubrobacterales bacterium]